MRSEYMEEFWTVRARHLYVGDVMTVKSTRKHSNAVMLVRVCGIEKSRWRIHIAYMPPYGTTPLTLGLRPGARVWCMKNPPEIVQRIYDAMNDTIARLDSDYDTAADPCHHARREGMERLKAAINYALLKHPN